MKSLTIPQNHNTAVSTEMQTISEHLPTWLQYLLAAYPQTRVSPMTYAVLEDQFSGFSPDVMMQAIRAHVSNPKNVFWPSVAELRVSVQAAAETAEQTEVRNARHAWFSELRCRRYMLLDRAYRGEFDLAEWDSLAAQYDSVGYEYSAMWVRAKAAMFASQ